MKTRGLRNNNPGNIRRTGERWRGMAPYQPDPEYVTFVSPLWGLRALARVLRTYHERHGLKTVREIITRWAPPTENDTESYIRSVAGRLQVDPDEPLNLPAVLPELVAAIVRHENGVQPYAPELIAEGVRLAYA